jgi:hypothetical protein
MIIYLYFTIFGIIAYIFSTGTAIDIPLNLNSLVFVFEVFCSYVKLYFKIQSRNCKCVFKFPSIYLVEIQQFYFEVACFHYRVMCLP